MGHSPSGGCGHGAAPAVVRDEVATGFARPLCVRHAGDGSGRLLAVEQAGRIRIVPGGAVLAPDFLDLSATGLDLVSGTLGAQGLLGLAFHPDCAANGRFFVSHTRKSDGASMISEFHRLAADPNVADRGVIPILGPVAQPEATHSGGWLGFGPDGYLYLALGDGGDMHGEVGNGQNIETLLGKILRIDVETGPGHAIPPDTPTLAALAEAGTTVLDVLNPAAAAACPRARWWRPETQPPMTPG